MDTFKDGGVVLSFRIRPTVESFLSCLEGIVKTCYGINIGCGEIITAAV